MNTKKDKDKEKKKEPKNLIKLFLSPEEFDLVRLAAAIHRSKPVSFVKNLALSESRRTTAAVTFKEKST